MDNVHEKVRGLLRKAESTPYEEEAQVFFNKAQELIAKYAIDQEALWATDPTKREQIITVDITLKDKMSGAMYRRQVLAQIAINNNCRMWYKPGYDTSVICGYPSDTAFVEMLYASVMSHMNFRMADALARLTAEGGNTRTFRRDFTGGYAERVTERLQETRREQLRYLREHRTDTGKTTDLVLRDRAAKVDDWVDTNMNLGVARRTADTYRDGTARGAGYMSGNSADLTGGKGGSLRTGRKALGK
jgi:Protein of unknown function (DUF2786)